MSLSANREKWREAKKTYKVQLAAIKFDEDFGPDLDKLAKLQNSTGKSMGEMMSLDTKTKDMAKKASATAQNYINKVNHVTDNTAKAALLKVLHDIKSECDNWAK